MSDSDQQEQERKQKEDTVKKHEEEIKKRKKEIETHVKEINERDDENKKRDDEIKKRDDKIKKLEAEIKKYEDGINKYEDDEIKTLEAGIKKHEADIKKLEAEIKTLEAGIKNLEADTKKLEADIKKNKKAINKHKSDTKKHKSDTKKLEADTKTLEADIKKHKTDIKKHKTDIKNHEADIKKLEAEIKKNKKAINKHEGEKKKNMFRYPRRPSEIRVLYWSNDATDHVRVPKEFKSGELKAKHFFPQSFLKQYHVIVVAEGAMDVRLYVASADFKLVSTSMVNDDTYNDIYSLFVRKDINPIETKDHVKPDSNNKPSRDDKNKLAGDKTNTSVGGRFATTTIPVGNTTLNITGVHLENPKKHSPDVLQSTMDALAKSAVEGNWCAIGDFNVSSNNYFLEPLLGKALDGSMPTVDEHGRINSGDILDHAFVGSAPGGRTRVTGTLVHLPHAYGFFNHPALELTVRVVEQNLRARVKSPKAEEKPIGQDFNNNTNNKNNNKNNNNKNNNKKKINE